MTWHHGSHAAIWFRKTPWKKDTRAKLIDWGSGSPNEHTHPFRASLQKLSAGETTMGTPFDLWCWLQIFLNQKAAKAFHQSLEVILLLGGRG